MNARRAVNTTRASGDAAGENEAHRAVDAAKVALGERGPVWWEDGASDLNGEMVQKTPYAEWFARHDDGGEQQD